MTVPGVQPDLAGCFTGCFTGMISMIVSGLPMSAIAPPRPR
jgi:hypothetical protein